MRLSSCGYPGAGRFLREPPGSSHTLVAYGTPLVGLFQVFGRITFLDQAGKPIATLDVFGALEAYRQFDVGNGLGEAFLQQFIR